MPIKIYRRGNVWHYRGSVAGRRLRGTTGASEREDAEVIAAKIESRAWQSHIHGPETIITFAKAAILYRQAGKSVRYLEQVSAHWKDTLVRDITPGLVRQAALTIYPNAGPATRNRQAITPTQAVINHAAGLGLCAPIRVKRFTVPKREKDYATWAWVEAFMDHANPHLGALACFMFLTGARISEAVSLRWDDTDLANQTALIRQTKNSVERKAHLPGPLLTAMANIDGRNGKVFKYSTRSTARIQWDRAIKRADIKQMSFHACRHGFATALLRAGVDPVTVARLGGWKSAQHVFQTYGHAIQDQTLTDKIAPVWHEIDTTSKANV